MSVAAQEKVRCLEAAIAALGNTPDLSVLKTLQDAFGEHRKEPVCRQCGSGWIRVLSAWRARRRLAKVEEDFNRVQEERAMRATELVEGLARLWCASHSTPSSGCFPFAGGDQRPSGRSGHVASETIRRGGGFFSQEEPHGSTKHSFGNFECRDASVRWFSSVHSRYGLRGERIGEASHLRVKEVPRCLPSPEICAKQIEVIH